MISTFLVVSHFILTLTLIALVLMQKGKDSGAGMGMGGIGGASQTLFGSRGSGSFITRLTTILLFCFFGTSIGLGLFYTPSHTEDVASLFAKSDTSKIEKQ